MSEVHVYGPAYLDRVLRIDRPLHTAGQQPVDRSADGSLEPGPGLALLDDAGTLLRIDLPQDWPGPFGVVRVRGITLDRQTAGNGPIPSIGWHDDLGGMGAGYASALCGTLVCALGPETDSLSGDVLRMLKISGIDARPIQISGKEADWTLLISSGPHGDKLAAGFRGCHAALKPGDLWIDDDRPPRLTVVAGLPNPLSSFVLRDANAPTIRVFAPAMRNMVDRACPLADFAGSIDILACNRLEWESLAESGSLPGLIPVVIVTDGPEGAQAIVRAESGEVESIRLPAFPRTHPPRDTNRAGEAFASSFVRKLLAEGWTPGPVPLNLLRGAMLRASAAAALVLDRERFGFPDTFEVERAVALGRVD
ncbi:carbohydrate kinase family protein [Isosphaeraceae bacterium EP7]